MAAKLTDIAIRNACPKDKKYKLSAGRGLTLLDADRSLVRCKKHCYELGMPQGRFVCQ